MKAFYIVGLVAILAILIANSPAAKPVGDLIGSSVIATQAEMRLSKRELAIYVNAEIEAWKR